ncbi:MAG: helix-turn-helix domain-containing protein [Alphaproteobacteria bacterium]|nr:helix-turn-helix domain-containing protein [Alphaproteobacteria bacterium]MBU1513427.1 helix-turn-helix domain-containing protein [Alphaproteobacteria bacterium]MBU2096419.1 helix-turn-helix domain-containing protein [Alphaproteobacteria bacterium]MBU2149889.1 helix-turn-helix domain-containing protein [Alphaproteobacteria bacterium]MBU2308205.1 helix-turn-helix domain-containing protein [Alphaproteobacteria bacterium]
MGSDIDILVGRQLRRRRRMLGMTQQQVGDAAGVSFQQIQKYECASNRLSVALLWTLACVLDVEVAYFFAGAERDTATSRSTKTVYDRAA